MKSLTGKPCDILALVRERHDQTQLINLGEQWRLRFAGSYEEAEAILQGASVEVIVSDYRIDDHHSWRDFLKKEPAASTPLVIVVDRNAEEAMWVKVLAEGAFDLLRKPLDRAEVDRALSGACRTLRQPTVMLTGRTADSGEGSTKEHVGAPNGKRTHASTPLTSNWN